VKFCGGVAIGSGLALGREGPSVQMGASIAHFVGKVFGLVAIAYNRGLLETLAAAERLGRLSVELRAGLIGAAVGTLGWFAPSVVGGGDAITQRGETLSVLPLVFLIRFGLGTVSYAAGTPGGLFAPMLALGAQLGLFSSDFSANWHSLTWTFRQKDLPSSEWLPSSPALCALR
jgi:H+/Cl- antiporter ClcA